MEDFKDIPLKTKIIFAIAIMIIVLLFSIQT
jgi:hypothetical protein